MALNWEDTNSLCPFEVLRKSQKFQKIVARFLALVTTMVTKVDHGNHLSNDRGNDRSNHRGYYDRYYNGNT